MSHYEITYFSGSGKGKKLVYASSLEDSLYRFKACYPDYIIMSSIQYKKVLAS